LKLGRWLDFGGVEVGKPLREVCNCSVGVRKAAVELVMPSVDIGKRAVEVGKTGVVVVGQGVRKNCGKKAICANSMEEFLDAERLFKTSYTERRSEIKTAIFFRRSTKPLVSERLC